LSPLATLDVMKVVAVLLQEVWVVGLEGKTITALLEGWDRPLTCPVLVAGHRVRVEAKLVWTFELYLGSGKGGKKKKREKGDSTGRHVV